LGRYNLDWQDDLQPNQITDWAVDKFVKPECGMKIYDYLEDRTLYDKVQPIDGALEAINELREDWKIIYVTHSTKGHYLRKSFWLYDNGFLDPKDSYAEMEDKSEVNAFALIDDYIKNVTTFRGANGRGLGWLFSQSWNLKYNYSFCLSGWWKAPSILKWWLPVARRQI
jgi:5'(3')-deoxyribonucleotidase